MTVTLTLTLVGDDPTQKASQPIPASYSQYATANYLYLARYILGLILQVFWDMTMPRSPQIITLMLAEGAAAATVQASLGLASGFELGFVFRMGWIRIRVATMQIGAQTTSIRGTVQCPLSTSKLC